MSFKTSPFYWLGTSKYVAILTSFLFVISHKRKKTIFGEGSLHRKIKEGLSNVVTLILSTSDK
jgi:hypothetical protein